MFGRSKKPEPENVATEEAKPLRDAVREARIEAAERTGVIVDMRDADVARLELLNEALDPLFSEVPQGVDLFDRGISRGDTPRLWFDAVAHVEMGRDKRMYRFVQDSRYGRTTLAESYDAPAIVAAVTKYIARRLVDRDRALAGAPDMAGAKNPPRRSGRGSVLPVFLLGVIVGIVALFALAVINPH